MALEVNIKKRTLHFTEDKQEIYVATADRGSVITTEKIASEVSDETGYKPAVVRTILSNLVDRMVKWMEEGHGVRFDGFGSFMPVVKSDSSENADEVSVKRVRISFFPSKTLAQKVNAINIVTTGTDAATTTGDDATASGGSSGGSTDSGDGETFT